MYEEKIYPNESYMTCEHCLMFNNCHQTYKECRLYNKELWKNFDKQVNDMRRKVFDKINKEGEESYTFREFNKHFRNSGIGTDDRHWNRGGGLNK